MLALAVLQVCLISSSVLHPAALSLSPRRWQVGLAGLNAALLLVPLARTFSLHVHAWVGPRQGGPGMSRHALSVQVPAPASPPPSLQQADSTKAATLSAPLPQHPHTRLVALKTSERGECSPPRSPSAASRAARLLAVPPAPAAPSWPVRPSPPAQPRLVRRQARRVCGGGSRDLSFGNLP